MSQLGFYPRCSYEIKTSDIVKFPNHIHAPGCGPDTRYLVEKVLRDKTHGGLTFYCLGPDAQPNRFYIPRPGRTGRAIVLRLEVPETTEVALRGEAR